MPNSPLLECTFPRCVRRQKESRCFEHRWVGNYHAYRRLRRRMIAEHVAKFGLRCPGADGVHHAHDVAKQADLTADHIIPRSRGGTDDRRNLRVVCAAYNVARSDGRNKMIDYRNEARIDRPTESVRKPQAVQPPPAMKVVKVTQPGRPKPEATDEARGKPRT